MVRGRVWVPPAAGMSPRFASGILKEASVDARRRSQRRAISNPEPMQWPWMATIRGLSRSRKRPQRSRLQRASRAATTDGAVPNSVRSAPAQKLLPMPERRIDPISGVVAGGFQGLIEIVSHGGVEGVVDMGAVEFDFGDGSALVVDDGFEGGHLFVV